MIYLCSSFKFDTPKQIRNSALVSWYRPPDSDKIAFDSLRQLAREDKEIIVCEDTNCDFKDPKKTRLSC